ncbi:MAG: thiol peroxidase [Bacteroidetes bacterium]|jgi:thioredoxin-dependent peroxiredoxin|nr:thiol peroxidase [Bacteroidota bacterium]MDA0828237.1 thiol peroxidase [Bacteroidota bacterium]MDA1198460.1 thiol peroxidase [Bacteroidota bacterium]
MANITLGGNPCTTVGELPAVGSTAPAFTLTAQDLSAASLSDYSGKKVVLNIFPSIDTGVCQKSVRAFTEKLSAMDGVQVLNISMDLPFAGARFCAAEGMENVAFLSAFKTPSFGSDYGVTFADSKFAGLFSRAVVVVDASGQITHTEQVPETGQEPNYEAVLAAL